MDYTTHNDEEIIALIQNGEADATEYMLKKYFPLVKKSIRTLYLIGADTEDLSQEGMIGLFKAIQSFQPNNNASFYTFAKLCIDRQIYSAIKASNRKKHSPLNSYISFYSKINEDEMELIDNLEAGIDSNPEQIKPFLDEFPEIPFIGAHFAGWSIWEEATAKLAGIPNLYVDLSSSLYDLSPETAVELIHAYGSDKVLWGTDYPMWESASEMEYFNRLDLTDRERSQILYENAAKLLNIE